MTSHVPLSALAFFLFPLSSFPPSLPLLPTHSTLPINNTPKPHPLHPPTPPISRHIQMLTRVINPRIIIRPIIRVLIARVTPMEIDRPRQHRRDGLPLIAVAVQRGLDLQDVGCVDEWVGGRGVDELVGYVEHVDEEVVLGDDVGEVGVAEDDGEFVAVGTGEGC